MGEVTLTLFAHTRGRQGAGKAVARGRGVR